MLLKPESQPNNSQSLPSPKISTPIVSPQKNLSPVNIPTLPSVSTTNTTPVEDHSAPLYPVLPTENKLNSNSNNSINNNRTSSLLSVVSPSYTPSPSIGNIPVPPELPNWTTKKKPTESTSSAVKKEKKAKKEKKEKDEIPKKEIPRQGMYIGTNSATDDR